MAVLLLDVILLLGPHFPLVKLCFAPISDVICIQNYCLFSLGKN